MYSSTFCVNGISTKKKSHRKLDNHSAMQQLLGIPASSFSWERSCLVFAEWRCSCVAVFCVRSTIQFHVFGSVWQKFLEVAVVLLFPVPLVGARPYSSSTQNAYALSYCHLWPVWMCQIYAHYLINCMIFGKKVIELKFMF